MCDLSSPAPFLPARAPFLPWPAYDLPMTRWARRLSPGAEKARPSDGRVCPPPSPRPLPSPRSGRPGPAGWPQHLYTAATAATADRWKYGLEHPRPLAGGPVLQSAAHVQSSTVKIRCSRVAGRKVASFWKFHFRQQTLISADGGRAAAEPPGQWASRAQYLAELVSWGKWWQGVRPQWPQ